MKKEEIKSKEIEAISIEVRKKKPLEKFGFLIVIVVAVLIHFLIKKIGLDSSAEKSAIFILWLFAALVFLVLISNETIAERDRRLSESDLGLFYKPNNKRIYLEKSGIRHLASVDSVTKTSIGGSVPSMYNYVITYSFFVGNETFINKKLYSEDAIQNVPTVADKIEIMYDKSNPNNSIITHEIADRVKWHQLQKKYKIKIINN